MQVTTEQIDPCKIALTISVEPERFEAAKEKAFGQFARNLQLPGFRKGKVPAHMAKAYVDESRVKQRAAEMLVEPAYEEAIAETKLEPYANPELELVEMNDEGPFVFKAMVPLRPVVTLGPYKGLEIERRQLQVTDADVERQIEDLRNRAAEYSEVDDRPAQTGDVLFADLTAVVEGQETPEMAQPRGTLIEIGKNIPDFDNGLVGLAKDETRTIEAIYPDDFPEETMRGKRATFTVTVKDIRSKDLPELNDEFAQKVNPELTTVEALKSDIQTRLETAAREMADNDLEVRLVDQIVSNSQISFPDILLRAEMQEDANTLRERLERENATIEQYLEAVGKTREEVEQQMAAAADQRIRNSLVLAEVARAEEIAVEEADIEKELADRAERAKVSVAAVRAFAEKNDQMEAIRNRALTQKVLALLKSASTVTEKTVTGDELDTEAPETAEEAAVPAAALPVEKAPKRRGKKAAAEDA